MTSKLVKMESKKEEVILKAQEIKRPETKDLGDVIVQAHLEQQKSPNIAKEELSIVLKESTKLNEEWYIVKSGDNPWKIAKSEKIDYEDILKLNQLTEHKAKNLKPGDRIRIK
jgi:hypothetical protein